MNIVAINGSTRAHGNTEKALEILKEHLEKEDHTTQIINLRQKELHPCLACYKCRGKLECVQDDDINEIFDALRKADALILGSPTYFSNVSSRMAMFIERTGIMSRTNDNVLKNKVGAAV